MSFGGTDRQIFKLWPEPGLLFSSFLSAELGTEEKQLFDESRLLSSFLSFTFLIRLFVTFRVKTGYKFVFTLGFWTD